MTLETSFIDVIIFDTSNTGYILHTERPVYSAFNVNTPEM